MSEMEIIKELFKAFASRSSIVLQLKDMDTIAGIIEFFDGENVLINGQSYPLSSIIGIGTPVEECIIKDENKDTSGNVDILPYVHSTVQLTYAKNGETFNSEGFIFAFNGNQIVLVNNAEKKVIDAGNVITIQQISEVNDVIEQPETYTPNPFERALISGDKAVVDDYIQNPEKLKECGYTDSEISSIVRRANAAVVWNNDERNMVYHQARRLYEYQGNRHQLVKPLVIRYLDDLNGTSKYRNKAVNLLIDIIIAETPSMLDSYLSKFEDNILRNPGLTLRVAEALVKQRKFDMVKTIIEKSGDNVDFGNVLFSMKFYEKYSGYDFASLPGLNVFDNKVNAKELNCLMKLPDKSAFLQLLSVYSKFNRNESFFALLEMFMPYARNELKVSMLLEERLTFEDNSQKILTYLPQFPLLWFNKILVLKYEELCQKSANKEENNPLLHYCERVKKYSSFINDLENAVITGNWELFDVLRGNNSIMLSLGYTSDEIERIRSIDIDGLRYSKKTVVEKLVELEGNRNYIPESLAGHEFLSDPCGVGAAVFPGMIEEGYGELVFELFNYSPFFKAQVAPLREYYLYALVLLNKKQEFWNEIKDNWISMHLPKKLMTVGRDMAERSGCDAIAHAMDVYMIKPEVNEFEKALISGDVSKLRLLVTDADYLTSVGYTVDEIATLQESSKRRIDITAKDFLSIANRLYVFQKNKNRTAELYYHLAINDVRGLAASGLFSIYDPEINYEDLCSIYEQYLASDDRYNIGHNTVRYLFSLYKICDYTKYREVIEQSTESIAIDPLITLIVMLKCNSTETDIEKHCEYSLNVNENNKPYALESILFLAKRNQDAWKTNLMVELFNSTFIILDEHEIQIIRDTFKDIEDALNETAAFDGLFCLIQGDYDLQLLCKWCRYILKATDDFNNKIAFIRKVIFVYGIESDSFWEMIRTLIEEYIDDIESLPEDLKKYRYPLLRDVASKEKWLTDRLSDTAVVEKTTFELFCTLSNELKDYPKLYQYLSHLSGQEISESEEYYRITIKYLKEGIENNLDSKQASTLLKCMSNYLQRHLISNSDLQILRDTFRYLGDTQNETMVSYILDNHLNGNAVGINAKTDSPETSNSIESPNSLFNVLKSELDKESIHGLDSLLAIWGRYIRLTESDFQYLESIRDYYNLPEKWNAEELEALAKAIFCKSNNSLYWNLLSIYSADSSAITKCNVHYHAHIAQNKALTNVLLEASDNNLCSQAIEIIEYILSFSRLELVEQELDTINTVLNNHKDWLSDKNIALALISAVKNSNIAQKSIEAWDKAIEIAMRISFASHIEENFYTLFLTDTESDSIEVNIRFLCGLVLSNPSQKDLIQILLSKVRNDQNVPLCAMISDILLSADYIQMDAAYAALLKLIRDSRNILLDEKTIYDYYLHSVIEGKQDLCMQVMSLMAKYYPEIDFLSDIRKYELLSGEIHDDNVLELYAEELEKLKSVTKQDRIFKTIMVMLPGELYLEEKGCDVESVYEYGRKALSNQEFDQLRKQRELFMSLDTIFAGPVQNKIALQFLKCCFTRKWKDFITSENNETYINTIIRSDETIKYLLTKKSFDVLKGSVLAILDADCDYEAIIDRADALISVIDGLIKSKNYLRRIVGMEPECSEALRKVFALRIESWSLREKGLIGSTILQIPNNEKVAFILGMLSPWNLETVFNHDECLKVLKAMPSEKARAISEIYSTFFAKGSNNIFSDFLLELSANNQSIKPENPYNSAKDNCKYVRELYLRMVNIVEKAGDGEKSKSLNAKQLFAKRAQYLYLAIINESESDLMILHPSELDFFLEFTYLFNKKSIDDIKTYWKKLDTAKLYPSIAMLLVLLEQYELAFKVIDGMKDTSLRDTLFWIQGRYMNGPVLTPQEKKIRKEIKAKVWDDNSYIIGKFYPYSPEQIPMYVEKMSSLRSFLDEALKDCLLNGIDISDIQINQEKYLYTMSRYQNNNTMPNEVSMVPKNESSSVNVEKQLGNEIIEVLVEAKVSGMGIAYIESTCPTEKECLESLLYFYEERKQSSEEKDILAVRDLMRWLYIRKMELLGYSRTYLNNILSLISTIDSISAKQWQYILLFLNQYFESIDSLSKLARIAENDLRYLKNLDKASNSTIQLLRVEDIQAWNSMVHVLAEIAGTEFEETNDTTLIYFLTKHRNTLLQNNTKRCTKAFLEINSKLLLLIGNELAQLRNNPELTITILEEGEDHSQTLIWEEDNNKGTLFAIVSNIGGAACNNVTLVSSINMRQSKTYEINTIYPGEQIPFKITFDSENLMNGEIRWNLVANYFDDKAQKMSTVFHETKAVIQRGGEPLNTGNIITGKPATGKNFVGRSRELTLLRNHFSEVGQLPSVLIRGLKRSGKSSLILKLSEQLKRQDKFLVVYVDGQSIGANIKSAFIDKVLEGIRMGYRSVTPYKEILDSQFDDFKRQWLEKMATGDWIGNLDIFYYELSQLFRRKLVIFIDEMESIFYSNRFESVSQEEDLYAALRSLIQKPANYVSFVFCGSDTLLTSCLEQRRESQMFQTLQYVEVGRMNIGDIREIFNKQSQKYDIEFTADAVDTIWQYTHGLVWYAKLLGYLVVNNILAKDYTVRKYVNRSDITTAVQMLINGEIGTDKYDLLDASLNTIRTALVHAMASIMPDYNKEVTIDEIMTALQMMKMEGYRNPRTGEAIPEFDEKIVVNNLDFLEKMQFIDANAARTRYSFTAELYRLFFRKDKKLHLFEERSI